MENKTLYEAGDIVTLSGECVPIYLGKSSHSYFRDYIFLDKFCLVSKTRIEGIAMCQYCNKRYYVIPNEYTSYQVNNWNIHKFHNKYNYKHSSNRFLSFGYKLSKTEPKPLAKFVVLGSTKLNRSESSVIANKEHLLIVKNTSLDKIGVFRSIDNAQNIIYSDALTTRFIIDLLAGKPIDTNLVNTALFGTAQTKKEKLAAFSVRGRYDGKPRVKTPIPYCRLCGLISDVEPFQRRCSCGICGKRYRNFTTGMTISTKLEINKKWKGKVIFTSKNTTIPLLSFLRHVYW